MKQITQIPEDKIQQEEKIFNDLSTIYFYVKELEDRYYSTTIAWEKELRDLINKCKIKSERIVVLEG